MFNYIETGDWQSDQVQDLHVLEWQTPLLAPAPRPLEPMAGRMMAPEDPRRDYKGGNVTVTLAMLGSDRSDIRRKLRPVLSRLWAAHHLILSDMPGHHYRGHVSEIKTTEDYEEWMSLQVVFVANPPCLLRTLGPKAGWIPEPATPICEQITELNATHNLSVRGAIDIAIGDGPVPHAPEVHMLLLGSWDRLEIGGPGGLTIPGLPLNSAVWVDCNNMQVYDKVAGSRTPVPKVSGSYEAIGADGRLQFDGLNLDLTAHVLIIERS